MCNARDNGIPNIPAVRVSVTLSPNFLAVVASDDDRGIQSYADDSTVRAQKSLGLVGGTPHYKPIPGFEVPDVAARSYTYSADGRLYAYTLPTVYDFIAIRGPLLTHIIGYGYSKQKEPISFASCRSPTSSSSTSHPVAHMSRRGSALSSSRTDRSTKICGFSPPLPARSSSLLGKSLLRAGTCNTRYPSHTPCGSLGPTSKYTDQRSGPRE